MPSEDAYQAVLAELSRLIEAWQHHREVINRAVNQLNHEVIEFSNRLDKDDRAREKRQGELDTTLKAITDGQDHIRRWQRIRLGVELVVILMIAAYLVGMSR